jgi:hypothetical protein
VAAPATVPAAAAAPAVKREPRAEAGGQEIEVIDLTDSPPPERA